MRLSLRSLARSSFVASLVSMALWYASPAAAADANTNTPAPLADKKADKKNDGEPQRPEIKWTPPEKNMLVPGPAAPEVKAQNEDYYSRRAKKILEAERVGAIAVHPLAAANPGQQSVICDAGCREEDKAEIVYAKPKQTTVGKLVPTSSGPNDGKQAPVAANAASIDCLAGCYDGAKSWPARPAQAKVSTVMPPKAAPGAKSKSRKPLTGDWSTEVAREPARDHLSPVR